MVKESWFNDAINTKDPVDMFVLFGHNPVRKTDSSSTFKTVWDQIRAVHKNTPIQIFGGHSHIRDFAVYDDSSVGIESGRYCETLGWMSMTGFDSSNSGYKGVKNPHGVDNPKRKATDKSVSPFVFSRRYLDWNRPTFTYHSRTSADKFDYHSGLRVSEDITDLRKDLNLGEVYGCAPQTYCMSCVPFTDPNNIFPAVIVPAVAKIVANESRSDKSRIIIGNTGAIRLISGRDPSPTTITLLCPPSGTSSFTFPMCLSSWPRLCSAGTSSQPPKALTI